MSKRTEEVVALKEAEAAEIGERMTRSKEERPKKRKLDAGELSFSLSPFQLKRSHGVDFAEEYSSSTLASETSNQLPLSSTRLTHALPSYCSSNDSSQLAEQNFTDPEEGEASSVELATSATYDIRKKTSPTREQFEAESAELESYTTSSRPSPANSHCHSSVVKTMPSDTELEDFFATAEKELQKQFAKKYNFDIAKDEAMEGRYEWVGVSP